MGSGEARPVEEMLTVALEVVGLLADSCTRIAIAGSIRRGEPMVKDIELVCVPAFKPLPSPKSDFIVLPNQNALDYMCEKLRQDGIIQPRMNAHMNPQSWGSQQKWACYRGVNLDIYAVLPGFSWGRELLIRTGPGDANAVLVTRDGVINQHGHRGVCPAPYEFRQRELWCGSVHVPTAEEIDVFAALGLPYIAPHMRSVAMYQRWASRRAYRQPTDAWGKECGWPGRSVVDFCWPSRRGDDVWIGGQRRVIWPVVTVQQMSA